MSLNDTPSGERVHIGFFGRRNAGKSSVVNAVTNQQISVVSDVRGTTTDPVTKAMELLSTRPASTTRARSDVSAYSGPVRCSTAWTSRCSSLTRLSAKPPPTSK